MHLDYDVSYHCRCTITLVSERDIILKSLSQRMTFAGVLEGTPTKQRNDRLISELIAEVKQESPRAGSVHVISPQRRDYLRKPGDMSEVPHFGGPPQWLPMITCVGHFESFQPARDQSMDASSLSIIWFQDDFAMPIAPTALESIRCMDWASLAGDFEF